MMLCDGGLILLKSPSQSVVILESETEKPFKDLETRSSHRRRGLRSQLLESKFDKSRSERVWKPTRLDANSGTFKGKHLGTDEVELKAPELSSAINGDYKQDQLPINGKNAPLSDASRRQEIFRSSNSERFCEKPSSYAQDSSGDDWKSLSRALASGPKVSAISNHDLMRIAELRFSTDMNEGDGGSQVVLLQKALFWLGHLSKQSDITGYFGIETKQALSEFQEAHGVGQTGLWGPLSKQALWHIVSAEILHRAVDEKSSQSAEVKNSDSRTKSDIFAQVCQSWTPMKLAGVFNTALPEGDWRLLSGIALLVAGVLFGLLISKVSSPPLQSNLVKRRIVRSPELEKRNSLSRDEKEVTISSSSNGATIVNNTSKKPSYITDIDATGQVDALGVQEKKVFSGSRYISSLGHGVQNGSPESYGSSKKDAYASPVPAQKASGSKVGAESTRGKQTGSWSRPIRQSGSVSNMREDSKPPRLSPNARGTIGLLRKDNESMLPLSTSKNSSIGRKDKLPGPTKRFGNDLGFSKDDGAPVAMQGEDEPNVRKRIEELRKAVEAAEQNGQAAVLALAEERKRSQELEEKISKQRESAAALEDEVRVLKESHDALLESLRRKIGSATRGASLLYQNFKNDGSNS